jgi:nickel-dependent lactate racemase
MKIHLAYGKSGLDCEVPDRNLLKVLTLEGARALGDPDAALRASLERPINTVPLEEHARAARSACVVICDITRPVPNRILLPPLLETVERCGIRRDAITVLIATGLHRPSTDDEIELMVGREIASTYRIVSHRARLVEEQQELGVTRRGTPVYVDRHFCSAGLKITTGFIEPHLMAGFSGGRKLIAPGCAGELTIKALHSPTFLEDSRCREGILDGNPLHEELLEIAALAGHDFIINVTLDEAHAITGVFAGDPLAAHSRGVEFARTAVRCTVPKQADIVITTSAGYPLDLTLYQSVKGMTAALPIVKRGGLLIIAAECAEGLGSPEFTTMATSFHSASEFIERIMTNPVVIDQWQLEECAKAARHADVVLVSPAIAGSYRNRLFIRTADTVAEALSEGFRRLGPDATVAVVPKGPYTLVDAETS